MDGVQRISSIIKFCGDDLIRGSMNLGDPLKLEGLEKLNSFDGMTFAQLPDSIRLHFETHPVKVVTLTDKSDPIVRFDLFERLNKGGIALSPQEIRDCVYRGKFADFLDNLAKDQNFKRVVRLTKKQDKDGTREECVLRFFAFLNNYQNFVHSVVGFFNKYMGAATKSFDYKTGEKIFQDTFLQLATVFPRGNLSATSSRNNFPYLI